MRVGIITPGFSQDEKDWCIPALRNFVQSLAGHIGIVVFTLHYPHRAGKYRAFGSDVVSLGGRNARGLRRAWLVLRAVHKILSEHRKQRFDVLHAIWAGEPGVVASIAGKILRIPVVVSLSGGELVGLRTIDYGLQLSALSRIAVRFSLQMADVVTVASRYMQRQCTAYLGSGRKVELFPRGVDTSLFQPSNNHADHSARMILSVGSLTGVKNHTTLIEAFAKLVYSYPEIHLSIVGDGPMRVSLNKLAGELGVSDRISFDGHVEHHLLPRYYAEADVIALPSLHESQGMVALEALSCGTPVAGSSVGILPDLPEEVCRLAEPGDSSSLARTLHAILCSNEKREEMKHIARETIEKRFSVEACVERFLDLYRRLASTETDGGYRLEA